MLFVSANLIMCSRAGSIKDFIGCTVYCAHFEEMSPHKDIQFGFPFKNLALQSQDIYYVYLITREVIKRNSKIEVVTIGCGYYYFYSDLSKIRNTSELRRVYDVYQPIFGDVHNAKEITETVVERNDSVWNTESILSFFEKDFNDTDHLNDRGALKATRIINSIIMS